MTIVFITVSVNGKKSKPSAAVGASFQIGVDRKAVYTAESKAKIDDARTAYDALTDAQKALAENYYGIHDVRLIKAVGLDIYGADVGEIMKAAEDEIIAMSVE